MYVFSAHRRSLFTGVSFRKNILLNITNQQRDISNTCLDTNPGHTDPLYTKDDRDQVSDETSTCSKMDETSEQFQVLFSAMSAFVTDCMAGHDPSHNPAHVHRVVALANKILEKERSLNPTTNYNGAVIKLAALLHDIGDRKYLSKLEPGPGGETPDPNTMVQYALLARGAPSELASRVQTIVSHVSYTTECKDPAVIRRLIDQEGFVELAVVQDADRLDAIGAIGIGRCFTFLGAVGKKYCVDGKWEMNNSIEHFGDKLVKLEGMMKTSTGREMAKVRTERLKVFAGWWEEEMSLTSA